MSKKTGIVAFASGILAGATALFFSKEENRTKAKILAKTAKTKVSEAKAEYQKDPKKFKAKVKRQGAALAKKALKQARSQLRVTTKKVMAKRRVAVHKLVAKKPLAKKKTATNHPKGVVFDRR